MNAIDQTVSYLLHEGSQYRQVVEKWPACGYGSMFSSFEEKRQIARCILFAAQSDLCRTKKTQGCQGVHNYTGK